MSSVFIRTCQNGHALHTLYTTHTSCLSQSTGASLEKIQSIVEEVVSGLQEVHCAAITAEFNVSPTPL